MKIGVNFSYFRPTRVWRSLSRMNLQKTDSFDSREKWISLTFDQRDWLFWSLSTIDLEETDSFKKREVNFTYFRRRHCPNHSRRLIYKRQRFIRREARELHSLSIDESVQIIVDDGSRKERISRGETNDFTHFWSMGLSKTLSTIGLQKRDPFGGVKGISLTFDRRVFGDRCERWIYKRHRSIRGQRQENLTHLRSTKLSWSLSTFDLEKTEIRSQREKGTSVGLITMMVWMLRLVEW